MQLFNVLLTHEQSMLWVKHVYKRRFLCQDSVSAFIDKPSPVMVPFAITGRRERRAWLDQFGQRFLSIDGRQLHFDLDVGAWVRPDPSGPGGSTRGQIVTLRRILHYQTVRIWPTTFLGDGGSPAESDIFPFTFVARPRPKAEAEINSM